MRVASRAAIGGIAPKSEFVITDLMSAPFTVCLHTMRNYWENVLPNYIIENTLQKLFAAQRTHPNAAPVPSENVDASQSQTTTAPKPQKSTLHSFWKQLPAPPVQPPTSVSPLQQASDLPRCEDCDAHLQAEHESMDVDMDMEMGGAVESSPFACADCGKSVCGTCAVVSNRRHCLGCATKGREGKGWW